MAQVGDTRIQSAGDGAVGFTQAASLAAHVQLRDLRALFISVISFLKKGNI